MTLEQDRQRLSGVHFAQEAMRPHEREALHIAERMLRRIDAVLALHQVDPYSGPRHVRCNCEEEWPCSTVRAIEETA